MGRARARAPGSSAAVLLLGQSGGDIGTGAGGSALPQLHRNHQVRADLNRDNVARHVENALNPLAADSRSAEGEVRPAV